MNIQALKQELKRQEAICEKLREIISLLENSPDTLPPAAGGRLKKGKGKEAILRLLYESPISLKSIEIQKKLNLAEQTVLAVLRRDAHLFCKDNEKFYSLSIEGRKYFERYYL